MMLIMMMTMMTMTLWGCVCMCVLTDRGFLHLRVVKKVFQQVLPALSLEVVEEVFREVDSGGAVCASSERHWVALSPSPVAVLWRWMMCDP